MIPSPRRARFAAVTAILVLAALATAAPAAAGKRPAPLLPNGTFDRSLRGWTLSDPQANCAGTQNIVWVKSRTTGGDPVVDGGAAWLNACGGTPKPSIRQSVTVTAGTAYRLTGRFFMEGSQGSEHFAVRIDGSGVAIQLGGTDANGWRSFSHEFTAGSTSVMLEFVGEVIGDVSAYVDDLVLSVVPAP